MYPSAGFLVSILIFLAAIYEIYYSKFTYVMFTMLIIDQKKIFQLIIIVHVRNYLVNDI